MPPDCGDIVAERGRAERWVSPRLPGEALDKKVARGFRGLRHLGALVIHATPVAAHNEL